MDDRPASTIDVEGVEGSEHTATKVMPPLDSMVSDIRGLDLGILPCSLPVLQVSRASITASSTPMCA